MSIKDPVHGAIELTEMEKSVVACHEFQRLRRLRQLSMAHLVYPGANHTRFEHSLGTLHLASRMAEKLLDNEDERARVRMGALIHDIGHTAFSHEGERALSPWMDSHEKLGERMCAKGGLSDALRSGFSKTDVRRMWRETMFISSDIGADRMDYLQRDALYTGVAYGVIDAGRIMSKMWYAKGRIGVDNGALEACESLLVGRFMMFSTVYLHHTVRIATAMLSRAIRLAIKEDGVSARELACMGDDEALLFLSKKKHAGKYARMLYSRELFKQAFFFSGEHNSKWAEKTSAELSSKCGCEVMIDLPARFSGEPDFPVRANGKETPIWKISSLVRSLGSAEKARTGAIVICEEKYRAKVSEACAKL